MTYFLFWVGGHRVSLQFFEQACDGNTQGVARLFGFCVDKITDGRLATTDFLSYLWLRHLA